MEAALICCSVGGSRQQNSPAAVLEAAESRTHLLQCWRQRRAELTCCSAGGSGQQNSLAAVLEATDSRTHLLQCWRQRTAELTYCSAGGSGQQNSPAAVLEAAESRLQHASVICLGAICESSSETETDIVNISAWRRKVETIF